MSQGQLTAAPPAKPEQKFMELMALPANRERISSALGDLADPETFLAQIAIAITSDPDLLACTTKSKMDAAHICATMGLFPNLQQVALIPRRMFKGTEHERMDIDVMPQWQGYKALLERVPEVFEIIPMLVHTTDQFALAGDGPDIEVVEHKFNPLDSNRQFNDAKTLAGGYCKIVYRDGRPPRFHFVTTAYIEKCRGCAETQAVWQKWYEKQARKTLVRSLWSSRTINVDPLIAGRLEAVNQQDDALLGNDPRVIEHEPPAPHSSRTASIASQIAPRQTYTPPTKPNPKPTAPVEPTTEAHQPVVGDSQRLDEDPPEQTADSQQQRDTVVETRSAVLEDFERMTETAKSGRDWERLRDHFTGPDSQFEITADERGAINRRCDEEQAKLNKPAAPKKGQQKPLME